jgi:hypothetical protein
MSTIRLPELRRVSRRRPCPVCEKPDWCSVSADGCLAICMRVERGSVRRTRNDGFLHRLRASSDVLHREPDRRRHTRQCTPQVADAAYRALLDRLTLSPAAAHALRVTRQLSDETVTKNLYSSIPTAEVLASHCAAVAASFPLAGVPGFFRKGNRWTLNATDGELLIPVRDARGHVVACQLRSDDSERRYRWLSSNGRPSGVSSGAPIHFAAPELARLSGTTLLTEGTLKADCISESLRCAVVGVPGVCAFGDDIGEILRSELPGLDRVKVAFDADAWTNLAVSSALARLVRSLQRATLHVTVLRWDFALGKGFDDVLHAHARESLRMVSA